MSSSPIDSTSAPAPAPRALKILIGCDTFAPDINGAARFAERLAAGLVQRGHDVHVVAPNQAYRRAAARTEVIEGEPMTLHRLPSVRWVAHDWIRFVWPWRSKHYARQIIDQVKPDVVHTREHGGPGLSGGPRPSQGGKSTVRLMLCPSGVRYGPGRCPHGRTPRGGPRHCRPGWSRFS